MRAQAGLPETGRQTPIEIELLRAAVLVALALLGVTVVLPSLLQLAASPFR